MVEANILNTRVGTFLKINPSSKSATTEIIREEFPDVSYLKITYIGAYSQVAQVSVYSESDKVLGTGYIISLGHKGEWDTYIYEKSLYDIENILSNLDKIEKKKKRSFLDLVLRRNK